MEHQHYNHVISIHAPPRGATTLITANSAGVLFQFTPLREGRLDEIESVIRVNQFQFTPLREGRLLFFRQDLGFCHFNSRPSARGDARRKKQSR